MWMGKHCVAVFAVMIILFFPQRFLLWAIRMVKAVKMDNKELTAFLKAYASGLITLPEDLMVADSGIDPEYTDHQEDYADDE